jgi:hypothetical protein
MSFTHNRSLRKGPHMIWSLLARLFLPFFAAGMIAWWWFAGEKAGIVLCVSAVVMFLVLIKIDGQDSPTQKEKKPYGELVHGRSKYIPTIGTTKQSA